MAVSTSVFVESCIVGSTCCFYADWPFSCGTSIFSVGVFLEEKLLQSWNSLPHSPLVLRSNDSSHHAFIMSGLNSPRFFPMISKFHVFPVDADKWPVFWIVCAGRFSGSFAGQTVGQECNFDVSKSWLISAQPEREVKFYRGVAS